MTTRGSGASYIVTSICKVIAATSTVSTVYIDSEIFYPGLLELLYSNKATSYIVQEAQKSQVLDRAGVGLMQV